MESHLYSKLHQQEKTYWWSVARRRLVIETLQRVAGVSSFRTILDAGCGTGALLDDLRSIGRTTVGLDFIRDSLAYCRTRNLRNLTRGSADTLPFVDGAFEAVFSLDTIEHIRDDKGVLREIHRVLSDNGYCLITVPAFPFLWSERDLRLHHHRRYRKPDLVEKVESSGFKIIKCSYFSVFFFPVLAALVLLRKRSRKAPRIDTDIATVPQLLNKFFIALLAVESWLLRRVDFPLGVSLFCVAQKTSPYDETTS